MHRPAATRRRSSYAPQLCAAAASLLLLLSLSILHIRLSSSPRLPSSSNHSLPNSSFSSDDDDTFNVSTEDRIDDLDLLDDDDQNPLTPPTDTQTLFWDHALGVARISFDARSPPAPPIPDHPIRPDLAFASDDEPADEAVRAELASVRHVEDALLIGDSPLRDGWAKWLEGKGDFIRKDRMLRSSNHETLNPRNHLLLQDPDVAGSAGLTRGDRVMRRSVLKEMVGADSSVEGMEGGRRSLREKRDEGSGDLGLGFSEFVGRFFGGGSCSLRVFMVWNSPSWSFGVRQRRGVESLFYHHRDACVLMFSETVERDFFEEFVDDG